MGRKVAGYGEPQAGDVVDLLRSLVARPSYGEGLGPEDAVVRFLAARFDARGIPYVIRETGGKAYNLLARTGDGRPSIVLNSHLDTVPPGDPDRWDVPPFAARLADGKVYGRGACDAKASVAAMVVAFERLWTERDHLGGEVILSLVGAEETGGLGTRREIELGLRADAAIVGEPTRLTPHVAHKGRMVIEVTTRGVPVHSSNPDRGINAISKMARLIREFDALHERVRQRRHPLLGNASSAVTRIEGGVAVNVVPGECVLHIDRRLLPGETADEAFQDYKAIVDAVGSELPGPATELRVVHATAPAETAGTALSDVLAEVASEVLGRPVEPAGFSATCDMTYLVNQGGIPTVIFGPGDIALAHEYNEHVAVEELELAAEVYYRVCRAWTKG